MALNCSENVKKVMKIKERFISFLDPNQIERRSSLAVIILGSYMIRYPLGGMMSWVLQYLIGFQRLGHDVYFVEKSGYHNACFDPITKTMSDDCTYGIRTVNSLLKRFSLQNNWCFVDISGKYYGLSKESVEDLFEVSDLFVDMGTHGNWLVEAEDTDLRVLVDGEPGFTQMKMEKTLALDESLHEYDYYYTVGKNIGTSECTIPTAGKTWHHLYHPVVSELYTPILPEENAPFTTVMNWQSYEPLEYQGKIYGHKDIEFEKYITLPKKGNHLLEIAVAGKNIPRKRLKNMGWILKNAHQVTLTFDSFTDYIFASRGEFTVCKNGFIDTNSGWFSDRSAVYLACGRPVVMEDTGFSKHLPSGKGLYAVRTVEEAAQALQEITNDYMSNSEAARQIAVKNLDASKVLKTFLIDLNVK